MGRLTRANLPHPLHWRPPLEPAPRPCAWCRTEFTPTQPLTQTCSHACKIAFRQAARYGKIVRTPFPGIEPTPLDPTLPRCSRCDCLLADKHSIRKKKCLPCRAYERVKDEAAALAKRNRGIANQLAAFEIYERPEIVAETLDIID